MSGQTIGEKNKELWLELDRRAAEIADLKRQLAEANAERDRHLTNGLEADRRSATLRADLRAALTDADNALAARLRVERERVNAEAREERLRELLQRIAAIDEPYTAGQWAADEARAALSGKDAANG